MIMLKDFIKMFDNMFFVIFDLNDEILTQGTKKELINELYDKRVIAALTVNHCSCINGQECFVTVNYTNASDSEYIICR